MIRHAFVLLALAWSVSIACSLAWGGDDVPLPTGKSIAPQIQSEQDTGTFPINVAVSPDGKYVLVSDSGYTQALWSLGAADGKEISHVDFSNRRQGGAGGETERASRRAEAHNARSNGLYYGLVIAADSTVYAAQGGHDSVAVLALGDDGKLKSTGTINTRAGDFPAGLALDVRGRLYVANNAADANVEDPFKLSGSVGIYDRAAGKELGRYTFADSFGGTSNFPLGIAALGDGSKCYVAAERDDCVYAINTSDPANPTLAKKISVGAHPVCVLLTAKQDRLYVTNSLGDTVSVIDTDNDSVIGTIMLRPALVRDIPGVSPTGVALAPDEKTLYVALSDMNAIGVIDTEAMMLKGYIPAGWYPTAMTVSSDGKRLLVVNAKGTTARNPNGKLKRNDAKRTGYILNLLVGNVTGIDIPTGDDLEAASGKVMSENRLDTLQNQPANPLAGMKIKHVIYIIKENRTYDQVLGDLPQGNGEADLALFGREVTPNLHALAERFVLLDNLYASGEVSGDGWTWSTQGMADAYVSRNVPYNYSGRGRKFDFEGQNNGYITAGFPAVDEDGKPMAANPSLKNGGAPTPNVANTGRNLWDAAREAGVSIRNYGFFLSFSNDGTGLNGGPENYPCAPGLLPPGHDLAGVSDIDYRRFDTDYPDSDGPGVYFQKTGDKSYLYLKTEYGKAKVPSRFAEWNREFQMMLAKDPSGGTVPSLMMVRFMMDHTVGARSGRHSPRSMAADNDYAVGQLVDAVSQSPIWSSTAIFVIEDDAQDGNDHVDCHRTTGYVISPWIKAHSVDHRFYNTDSFLKTIELILGLKPLSQYDAVAEPIMDWDSGPTNADQFNAILPADKLMADINPDARQLGQADPRRELAVKSDAMDFSHADAAPTDELNQIIWQTVHGPGSAMPRPRETADGDDAN